MVEDMAVHHKVAGKTLVVGAHDDGVKPTLRSLRLILDRHQSVHNRLRQRGFYPDGVSPDAFQPPILQINVGNVRIFARIKGVRIKGVRINFARINAASPIDRILPTDISVERVFDFDNLERIHMDVERMAAEVRLQFPFIDLP